MPALSPAENVRRSCGRRVRQKGAIRLDNLWGQIAKSNDVEVLCGYPPASFQGGIGSHMFEKICAEHSAV